MSILPVGKLPQQLLCELLKDAPVTDPRVIVGPRIGEDAAVIDFGDRLLVAKTDPITFTADRIGWYALNVNANDVAVMGAQPKWFLATLLLPDGRADEAMVRSIFADLYQSCRALGIALCGGHTEVTCNLDRPILVGQMLGEVEHDRLVANDNARPGDDVIMTKGIAIEGTAIIARERGPNLADRCDPQLMKRAKRFLDDPGISVVKEALAASRAARVHAMHDPTEGGLATGLHELAAAGGTGVFLYADRVPVFAETAKLAEPFGIDPLGLIASGALLIACDPADTETVLASMHDIGTAAAVIGNLTEPTEGIRMRVATDVRDIPRYDSDELTKIF